MKSRLMFLLLLSMSLQVIASSNNQLNLTEIHTYADEAGFNGAILVTRNEKLIVEAYLGYADSEKTMALTRQHLFSPGSVGKEFTTVGMMQLEAQGLLSYEDKVSKYVKGLPEWASKVTIHQVLNHTSGFPKIKWHSGISTADAISQIASSEGLFTPGSGYQYSNLNVVVRALIIEAIVNMPFSAYLQQHVFEPVKITKAYQQLSPQDVSANQVAGDYPTYINGVTVYITPVDLLKFEQALTSELLLPFSSLQAKLDGDVLSGQHHRALYDFGSFFKDEKGALLHWQHDGSNPSHHTLKFHDFDNEIVIILMSSDGNKSTLYALKEKILKLLDETEV